jgi:hypothetical protein
VTAPGGQTAQALVAALRDGGMTQAQIARATGVSARMLRFVQAGQKPGTSYLPALQQLATQGRVTTPPPVRKQRVRAPGGVTVPAAPRPVKPAPARGRYGRQTTHVAGGKGTVDEITAPASNGKGRDQARADVLDIMKRAAQGRRRVAFVVEDANGVRVTLGSKGGYRASDALRRMRATVHGGVIDPLHWIDTEAASIDRYAFEPPGVHYVVTVF